MRAQRRIGGCAALLALCLAAPAAQAQVSVTFTSPERYTDAENRYGSGVSRRVALAEIRRLFVEFGARVLQPGQRLAIEVLDLDLEQAAKKWHRFFAPSLLQLFESIMFSAS